MNLDVERDGDVTVVSVHEPFIDASNFQDAIDEISPFLDTSENLLLDIHDVKYVDSSGLSTFAFCQRRSTANHGQFRICSPTQALEETFDLIHMDRFIGIYDSRESAISSFHSESLS